MILNPRLTAVSERPRLQAKSRCDGRRYITLPYGRSAAIIINRLHLRVEKWVSSVVTPHDATERSSTATPEPATEEISLSLSLSLSGIFPGISSRAQVSCLSSGILFFLRYPLPLVYCDMMLLSLILSSPPNPVRSFTMSACVDTPMTTEIRHMLP